MGKYRVDLLTFRPSLTRPPHFLPSLFPSNPAAFLGMTDESRKGMGKYRANLLIFLPSLFPSNPAAFLGMTDDSRKGMGKYRVNLLSFAAAAMAGMLKHADAALAVLRGCAGMLVEADALGIVDEAADRLADHAVTRRHCSPASRHLSPPPDQVQGGDGVGPAAAAIVPMQPSLGLLRCAIVLNASEGVKATLQRRAGALFTDASLDDLLMLETSDVQGLLHGFASEEHLSTLPDRAQALQAAASLIDAYLLHLSSPPALHPDSAADGVAAASTASASAAASASAGLFSSISAGAPANNEAAAMEDETAKSESQAFQPALSVAEWKHLVSALPADARPSHDGLLK
ncbi:unnamed protein product, partial [Closterium sp. Yama58-4]